MYKVKLNTIWAIVLTSVKKTKMHHKIEFRISYITISRNLCYTLPSKNNKHLWTSRPQQKKNSSQKILWHWSCPHCLYNWNTISKKTIRNKLVGLEVEHAVLRNGIKIFWNFTEADRVDCRRLSPRSAPYHRVNARCMSQQGVLQPSQPGTQPDFLLSEHSRAMKFETWKYCTANETVSHSVPCTLQNYWCVCHVRQSWKCGFAHITG
jgi:hypothetical protein